MHFHWQDSWLQIRSLSISVLSLYSYIIDIIFYSLILGGSMWYGSAAPPIFHEFSIEDRSIMYSHKTEDETAVPMLPLIMISVGFPIAQFFACSIFESSYSTSRVRRFWDIFTGCLCLWGAMSTQLLVTVILKNICGLPRPDLLARCQPNMEDVRGIEPFELQNVSICTNDNIQLLREGFRSFPSGHSSTVFCGMVISSLNICGKMQVMDKRGISFKVILAIAPLMVASFVSCTRISDNRHFLRDVIGGSFVGSQIGFWFYTQYFPSIFNLANKGRAYPPRRIGVSKLLNNIGGFWHIEESLPGAYAERVLNDRKAIEELCGLIGENEPSKLEPLPNNIEAVNNLTRDLKGCVSIA